MNKIPKIIHYVWFGDPPPPHIQTCIDSFRKHCPEYEIRLYNESNLNMNLCAYAAEALRLGKWAFLSDVVRVQALYEFGGIYMDTDVFLLKSLDEFLESEGFIGFFQGGSMLETHIWGCAKGNKIIAELKDRYDRMTFNEKINNGIWTDLFKNTGLVVNNQMQSVGGFKVYSNDFFDPVFLTKKAACIHLCDNTWSDKVNLTRRKVRNFLIKVFGIKNAYFITKTVRAIYPKRNSKTMN